jgi:hypothetical protein
MLTWSIQLRILEVLFMYFHPCMFLENVSCITFFFFLGCVECGIFILECNELRTSDNGKDGTSIRVAKLKIFQFFSSSHFLLGMLLCESK